MDKKDKIWIDFMEYGHRIGCHQIPERSFFYKKYQFPICARCTGVIFGELITIILLLVGIKINLLISVILLLIMGFDWFIQFIKLLASNNGRRLLTGISGGIGLTYIYYYIIIYVIELIINLINKS